MSRAVQHPSSLSPSAAVRAPQLAFKLDEIEKPRQLAVELSQAFLAELLEDSGVDFEVAGAGLLSGELVGLDGGALLRAELRVPLATACGRCLVPVTEAVVVPVTLRYVPRAKLAARSGGVGDRQPHAEKAGSFDPRDLDEEPFDGHRLDLTAALREQLILALPMAEFCRQDCAGLCPVCGQNRNEKVCDCKSPSGDPRWALLKNLKLGN